MIWFAGPLGSYTCTLFQPEIYMCISFPHDVDVDATGFIYVYGTRAPCHGPTANTTRLDVFEFPCMIFLLRVT